MRVGGEGLLSEGSIFELLTVLPVAYHKQHAHTAVMKEEWAHTAIQLRSARKSVVRQSWSVVVSSQSGDDPSTSSKNTMVR